MKKFLFFSFLISFALSCLISCKKPEDSPDQEYTPSGFGKLEGYLYLQEGGNLIPLQGYGIRVAGNTLVYTDSKGYFFFPKLPAGVLKLEVLDQMELIYSTGVSIQSDLLISVAIPLTS